MSKHRPEPAVAEPIKLTTREAVVRSIAEGLTSKEAAFKYGRTIHAMQGSANRLGVSFPWSGMGRPPKYPSDGSTSVVRVDPKSPDDIAFARIIRLVEKTLSLKFLRTDVRMSLSEIKRAAELELLRRMEDR
jgi:hypothetical protein